MSYEAYQWARQQRTGDPQCNLVLRALADFADRDGSCWPSVDTLVHETDLSKSTVRRAIQRLEKLGLIERQARLRGNGSQTSNRYRLKLDRNPKLVLEQGVSVTPLTSFELVTTFQENLRSFQEDKRESRISRDSLCDLDDGHGRASWKEAA